MVEKLTNKWDLDNKERIDRNFAKLGRLDLNIMESFLKTDPSVLTPNINGLPKADQEILRNLNNFGTNFTAEVNGVVHAGTIYVSSPGKMGFGLAEQEYSETSTAELYYEVKDLVKGWNRIELNFPVEQNKSYTLFKRNESDSTLVGNTQVRGWNTHDFMSNGLRFRSGKFLNDTLTYVNYGPFYEIELITNVAQLYKIANDSVKPPQQFYVGDNPPNGAQFWFKPVGGE